MYGIWYLLFDGIWRWHFIGHLDNLLNLIGHMLDHGIWLRHLDFHGHMHMLFHGYMDDLFDWHRHWHLLDDRQCFLLMYWEVWHMMMMIILVVV